MIPIPWARAELVGRIPHRNIDASSWTGSVVQIHLSAMPPRDGSSTPARVEAIVGCVRIVIAVARCKGGSCVAYHVGELWVEVVGGTFDTMIIGEGC